MGSVSIISARRIRHYRVLSVLWILLILVGLAFYLVQTYRFTYHLVAAGAENEAEILSRSMDATLRRVHAVMSWAEESLRRVSDDPPAGTEGLNLDSWLPDSLVAQSRFFPEVHGFTLYTPEGRPVLSTIDLQRLCDVDFDRYLDFDVPGGPGPGAYAYSETVNCPESGTRIMLVHTGLTDTRGEMLGILAAVINLSYFEQLFSRIEVGDDGMVSIRRSDTSRLVVRWPVMTGRLNNQAPEIPSQQEIDHGGEHGVVRYTGATDGVERIFAYRRVDEGPLYVLVGRGMREQFSSWLTVSAIAAGASMAMIVVTLALLRRLNRETADLIASDKVVQEVLVEKETLIRELLHRTNNTLQVVRSLVQLELAAASTPSPHRKPSSSRASRSTSPEGSVLTRLDARLRALALIQSMLNEENNYTWIPLRDYLESLGRDVARLASSESAMSFTVHCPGIRLVLDAAAPLGLIVSELLSARVRESTTGAVELRVSLDDLQDVSVEYHDDRVVTLEPGAMQLVSALAEHQLMGSFETIAGETLRYVIRFSPDIYRSRVGS